MGPTSFHQLLKVLFIIADFPVFDKFIHLVTNGERGSTYTRCEVNCE